MNIYIYAYSIYLFKLTPNLMLPKKPSQVQYASYHHSTLYIQQAMIT